MTYALITLLCVYLLWVHYVAVMRLMQVRDAGHLTTAMKAIGYPALVVGLLLDLIVNTVVATLILSSCHASGRCRHGLPVTANQPAGANGLQSQFALRY